MTPTEQCTGPAFAVILLLIAMAFGAYLIWREHRAANRCAHYFTRDGNTWACFYCTERRNIR